ncbi:condensin-2 complex subunit G2 [Protobothrops mucrosquamatus]|uniref:condensin-2 complex subunit G2 n=1 Tax=Protobothrops mucrosquamatus TaxID=103944 RepID=UPI0007758E98|nr:condensin-2 complex subunit G2 [Protobothrops mucrosquamatus]
MTRRETFLNVICKDSIEEFLHFIQRHMDVSDSFDLHELVQELSRKQKETLWNRLKDLLATVLLDNPIEEWHRVKGDYLEMETNAAQMQTAAVIEGVATIVIASIATLDENIVMEALLECVVILNGILFALPDSEKSLLEAIQCLNERWWKTGLEGKEQFGKAAFLMLLKNCLGNKTFMDADITDLYDLQSALLCFDYDSEESNEIEDLLLQCFMNPGYIKKEEGKRFLSFVFTWNVNFIKLIHETIKNQFLCYPRSLMKHIAEIYFRAWNKSSGEILEVIEYSCIQDFIHHAVHLPRKSQINAKVRELLSYFHKQNKCREGVEEVLYRLYEPILWRALKVRNSEIRSNAALLFGDVFPILDPNCNEDREKGVQRQFDELFALLQDPEPLVRSTGVLAVSKITYKYWEMIPAKVIIGLLKILTEELAFDASSADVRCAVFKCLPIILDNTLSHLLLEQFLPTLKYNIHDSSEKVRVAFVDMLLKIKAMKAAKFWNICPVEHLLARLEVDSRPVSRRLVNLLISSFLPINQPEVWCERCVTLIQMNASAARTFYQYVHEYISPTNIAKLMFTIRNCLNGCIQQELKESESGDEHSEKENMSVTDKVLSVDDIPSMAGLLEVIVILWRSIQKPLDCNEEAKNHIIEKFASVLPEYLKIFKDYRCVSPIIILASFIPPTAIPTFSYDVISELKNMKNGAAEMKYSTLLDCLSRWGKLGHILTLICDWITVEPRKRKTNMTQQQVQIQEMDEHKPELALDYLEYLLTHYMNQNCLLSLSREKLNQLLKVLECGKDALDTYIQGCSPAYCGLYEATAVRAFSLYCRLNIHLLYKFVSEEQDYLSALERTGAWIENSILPHFLLEDKEGYLKPSSEICKVVIKTYLATCKVLIAIGLGDFKFQASIMNLASKLIYRGKGSVFIPILLYILREIVEASLACDIDNTDCITELLNNVHKMFQEFLESMALKLRRQKEEGIQLIYFAQDPLEEFVHVAQSCMLIFPMVYQGVFSSLLAAVVVEINCNLKKKVSDREQLITPKTFLDLPPLSSVLMTIMNKSADVIRSFLNELLEYIESEESEGIISLTTSVYIVALINDKQPFYMNDIAATLQKKIMMHSEMTKEDTERLLCEDVLYIVNKML